MISSALRFLTDALTFILLAPYFLRYVILPRVKSYGDNSTVTLSPGKMRMLWIRILPDTCAITVCPLSSSTTNFVLGKISLTFASTSIKSSLAIITPLLSKVFHNLFQLLQLYARNVHYMIYLV